MQTITPLSIVEGTRRVIVSNVMPVIDNGKYVAKAVAGDIIAITANIFGDGHDEIAASIQIKGPDGQKWAAKKMLPLGNDKWEAEWKLSTPGKYQFLVEGWIDHYSTWKKGLLKKAAAGQNLTLEFRIGEAFVREAATRTRGKDGHLLAQAALELSSAGSLDDIKTALSEDVAIAIGRAVPKERISRSGVFWIDAERAKAAYSTWYELFPRSTSPDPQRQGTFKDVKTLLPRIAAMGFDVLYLPPIHPIGEVKRKGRNNSLEAAEGDPGSPWAIGSRHGGHKSVNPALGTLDDFRDLVRESKKYHIEIALDIAFQCAPDHPYVKSNSEWFTWRPDGTVQYAENPPKKYEDILPFNFESAQWADLWLELKSVLDFWIDTGVNIFRIDNPHTKSLRFWEWTIGEVRKKNPDVIFLAEAFTRPRIMEQLAKAGFNQSYTYFTWRNTKTELQEYILQLTGEYRPFFRPNFWPNTPDILPEHLVVGGDNAHIIRVLLAATLSSNYGLYGPVYELGINDPFPGKEEYNNNEKYEVKHWNWQQYTRIGELIIRINRIRRENSALHTTWNITLLQTSNDQLIAYLKTDKSSANSLIIVINLDPFHVQSGHIQLTGFPGTLYLHDLLSGEHYHWSDEWNYVLLNPNDMPAHIFRIEQQNNNYA